jgi:hypothetical protein
MRKSRLIGNLRDQGMRWPSVGHLSRLPCHGLDREIAALLYALEFKPGPYLLCITTCLPEQHDLVIFPRNPVFESTGGVHLRCQRDPGRYFRASAGF